MTMIMTNDNKSMTKLAVN